LAKLAGPAEGGVMSEVWLIFDSMNEQVVGVFSTEEAAVAYMGTFLYMSVERFTVDQPEIELKRTHPREES